MSEPADEDIETTQGLTAALSLDRLLMFTDGVFAIAITILVLDLIVPDGLSDAELWEQLGELVPALLAAALSFAVIGRFWISHHTIFGWIRRIDMPLMWLNLLLLAPIVFLPFSTRLLEEYANVPFVVIAYSATVAAVALANLAIWLYATNGQRLTDQVPYAVRVGKTAGLVTLVLSFLVAIVLAPFLGPYALFAYLLSALPADRVWAAAKRRRTS